MAQGKHVFYRRAFLNPPKHQSTAAVIAEVKRTPYREGEEVSVDVQITDCDKKITLDFHGTYSHKAPRDDLMKADLHKVAVLRDTFAAMHDKLTAEYARAVKLWDDRLAE